MNNSIRIGIVGCGDISHTHAVASKSVCDVDLVACCDINKEKAFNFQKKYDCKSCYTNFDEMLKTETLDAVILCTWPIQHLEQIKTALKYGVKNILCEKSMVLTGSEAITIQQLIIRNNAYLMEACKYRYHPAIDKIESLINSGEMGNIDNISATFSNYEPDDEVNGDIRNWRYKKECGGGVPYDWMSYLVNAANYFSKSKPIRVFASGTISSRFDVITRLYGMIEYENGITANISSSKNASFSQELEISCSKGIINLPVSWGIFGNVKIECRRRMQEWPYIIKDTYEIEHKDSFVNQLQNFVDVINGKANPKIPLSESVVNVITIESLVKSVMEKRIVDIELSNVV